DELRLDTVAIASSRVNQSEWQTGRNITLLTARDISQLPVASIDEALRYIVGVELQTRNSFGAQADVSIRGTNFNQVLILVDGMRINDPLTGHFNMYLPLSLAEISRIEVLRGPAAAMFGPDAVGGVIHLVSKSFDATYQSAETEAQAEVLYGQNNLLTVNAGTYLPGEKVTFSAGGNWNRTDGQPLPPDSTDIRNDFDIRTISASLAYQINDEWRAAIRGSYDLRTFNAQYFYTQSTFDLSREQTEQIWTQARLERNGERSRTSLDVAYKTMQDSFLFNPAFSANIHQTDFLNVQFHHQAELNEQFQLGVGVQGDRRAVESSDRGDHQTLHAGVYGMAHWEPADPWSINLSLRADADQNYGFELLPQANLAYQQGVFGFRAASGRSIRAADFTERFVSNNLSALAPGRNLGNPDLLAERSWNHEAGIDFRWPNGLKWQSTAFLRQGRNLIDYLLINENELPNIGPELTDSADYFFPQNLDLLDVYGFETNLGYRGKAGKGQIRGNVGYQFLDAIQAPEARSKYLASFARHLWSWQMIWEDQNIQFGIQGLYKVRDAEAAAAINANLAPSYSVWNARLGVRPLQQYPFYLQFQILNLFNAQYQDILGAKMPNRWVLFGLSWKQGL
ncbi:MAG: TonB-dependent receptor, partial [Bacteroidota bacterium]